MSNKKIIAVVGATGAQGSGLVESILENPSGEFAVRVLTRDLNSAKAKSYAEKGAEVVVADVDDPKSIEAAFKGAYGVFCITFFWNHFSVDTEMAHAKLLANASKAAGVKHVIWSTLEDTRTHYKGLDDPRLPTLQGKYKTPHFDGKGESDKFFKDAGVPVTYLLTSFYYENFIAFGMGPKKVADGKYALTLPLATNKMAMIASVDIGRCAYHIFLNPKEYIGKRVGIAGASLSGKEMAQKFSAILNKDVEYQPPTWEKFRGLGFPGAEDLGNMFQFYCEFEDYFVKIRDVETTKKLNPKLQSFDKWLEANKAKMIEIMEQ